MCHDDALHKFTFYLLLLTPGDRSHKPGGRLPITFRQARGYRLVGTKLYCLVTEARECVCEQLVHPKSLCSHALTGSRTSRPLLGRKSQHCVITPSTLSVGLRS